MMIQLQVKGSTVIVWLSKMGFVVEGSKNWTEQT